MKVLNFGSLNVDYVYRVDHIVRKGETLSTQSRQEFAGGKGLNQSIALANAGLEVFHAGCIGPGGEFLLDVLKNAGVDVTFVKRMADTPVGHTIIQNSDDGDNCILLYGGANQAVTREQIDAVLEHFQPGDYLVLQNEISNLAYLFERAVAKQIQIVCNPSPMNETVKELPLEKAAYLFVNEIEAGQLLGADSGSERELVGALSRRFPRTRVILTLGKDGADYIDGDKCIHQAIFPVKAVDTTAAGDTFTGFFMGGILGGQSPEEALRYASKAASIAVTRRGASPSIPTAAQVRAELDGQA